MSSIRDLLPGEYIETRTFYNNLINDDPDKVKEELRGGIMKKIELEYPNMLDFGRNHVEEYLKWNLSPSNEFNITEVSVSITRYGVHSLLTGVRQERTNETTGLREIRNGTGNEWRTKREYPIGLPVDNQPTK